MKTAVITGITGQDASYLAEILLEKDYNVVGFLRRSSTGNFDNIKHILKNIKLVHGDLTDKSSIDRLISENTPDEVYGLGAMSFVPTASRAPEYTIDVNLIGTIRLLEAIKQHCPRAKFFFPGSNLQFGNPTESPQDENTKILPIEPYGVSKAGGYYVTKYYRDTYGLFCATGILFNHASPRMNDEFVLKKIARGVARIKLGLDKELRLGNIDTYRDIGFSKDFVKAEWLMLQQETPEDYVIGTGETHSIREICEQAFSFAGLNYLDYVKTDESFNRPAEATFLLANINKIKKELNWEPQVDFISLINMMVETSFRKEQNNAV